MPTPFERAVLRRVRAIPRGRVTTYGDVAAALGRPGAARAVGAAVRQADDGRPAPYHRVVGADGRVGGAARGEAAGVRERARRLRAEGVQIAADGRVADFVRLRWPRRGGPSPSSGTAGRCGR
jgi:O-6-methylguanine DNA methyltransferase